MGRYSSSCEEGVCTIRKYSLHHLVPHKDYLTSSVTFVVPRIHSWVRVLVTFLLLWTLATMTEAATKVSTSMMFSNLQQNLLISHSVLLPQQQDLGLCPTSHCDHQRSDFPC